MTSLSGVSPAPFRPQMAASTSPTSTLMAIVATPNPVASTLPNTVWQPSAPSSSIVNYKSTEPTYKMTDLKSIQLDMTAPWRPMVNGNMLTGMYIPVKYMVATSTENRELKSFPYKFAEPIRMNFPVKVDDNKDNKDPNARKVPKATFTLYDDKNRESLDEIRYLEGKVNECLQANVDTVRKQRQLITQQFYKAATVKPPSTDKRDAELISMFKVKTGVNKITNAEVTYRNVDMNLNDDGDDAAPKNATQKWKPKSLPLFLFVSNTPHDFIQRNADGKITNGRPITVQQLMDEKIEKVSAVPVVAFGQLYFMFNPSFYGVRLKKYLRSCEFIQAPQFQTEQQFGSGNNKYTYNDFVTASHGSQSSSQISPSSQNAPDSKHDTHADEPPAKRIKFDDDQGPPGGMQFVVQPHPQAPTMSSLMDLGPLDSVTK